MPEIKTGDLHLVVDATVDFRESAKLFDHTGKLIKKIPCMAMGTNGPRTNVSGGDTPAGLYHVSFIQRSQPDESASDVWARYGEWFMDLFDDDGQERDVGRAGIGLHGGGSRLGVNPADRQRPLKERGLALALMQQLVPTNGCIRVHNGHLDFLAKRFQGAINSGNKCWITVVQR
jgi:hypothetical protein